MIKKTEVSVSVTCFSEFAKFYREPIHKKIKEYLPKGEPRKFMEMVYSYVDRLGQYRRPAYVVLWNMLYGGKPNDAILPAAVQQISEDYFLMHDDWMDSNELRRGKPTAHLLYGPAYAIDAGDLLHTVLWKMAYDVALKLDLERRKRYMAKIYDIMLVTHIGQYYDLHLTHDVKDITKFTLADYYQSIHGKSAYYSVYGPMQQGAIIAGLDGKEVERMKEYGVPIGIAFQIKDDILDCISIEEILGKSIGNDVRDGVKTIILWHAVHNASSTVLNKLKEIYAKDRKDKNEEEVRYVLDTFNNLGSIDFAQKEAEKRAIEALENFKKRTKGIKDSKIKRIAIDSFSAIVKRNK